MSPILDGVGRGSPVPNPNMKFGGLPYEMHRLGGRNEVISLFLIWFVNKNMPQ